MRNLFFLLLLFVGSSAFSQNSLRFTKYDVGTSGCKLYLPDTPDPVDLSYSPDSSKVYTIEALDSTTNAYYHFGAIVVDLKGGALADDEKEDMIISYMDYLKTAFNIESSAGYGKGHTLTTHETAKGVLDYWVDKDGDHWKVMGWAAEQYIIVQFVYGPRDYPNTNVLDIFFKGIRFPGD